jgi:hypothetical protein
MIQEDLTKSLFKKITSLNISPVPNDSYTFKDTIKQRLLDRGEDFNFTFNDNKTFEVELKCSLYKKALFSDYYLGNIRINEQINSLNSLLKNNNQAAWILVTAYYAIYFMSVEISKLFGVFIINFSKEDMLNMFKRSTSAVPSRFINNDNTNFSYQVKVTHSEFDDYVKLSYCPKSPKPHVEVWKNLTEVVEKISVDDCIMQHKTLFLDICDSRNNTWDIPSKVRNNWNYSFANYYGDRGTQLADTFIKTIKNRKSAFSWANNRNIQPHKQNITASIAYIYHCLNEVIEKINDRLNWT